jgi:hypothetical protein
VLDIEAGHECFAFRQARGIQARWRPLGHTAAYPAGWGLSPLAWKRGFGDSPHGRFWAGPQL